MTMNHAAISVLATGARRTIGGIPLAAALVGLVVSSTTAQPVTERSPNLEGAWVTSHRNLHFAFSHRFEVVGGDFDVSDIFGDAKIVNYPTFALTYGLLDDANLGFRYSSNSLLAGGPNEWQPYLKWSPLRPGERPLSLALTAAWNGAAQSVDGELNAAFDVGRLSLLGALRGFSERLEGTTGADDAAFAVGGGALFRLTRHVSFAADVADVVSGDEGAAAWSAGLQVGIPYTPHTLSLLATNVTSGTIQGASTGVSGAVYWGFEFTVPFSGIARWGRVLEPWEAEGAAAGARAVDGGAEAVVEIDISGFSFGGEEMRIPPGTTVRWVNRDPVGHTVTPDEGTWGSPLIGPGEVFEHTFQEPGSYPYHCIPHPYMQSSVVVTAAAAGAGDRTSPGGE